MRPVGSQPATGCESAEGLRRWKGPLPEPLRLYLGHRSPLLPSKVLKLCEVRNSLSRQLCLSIGLGTGSDTGDPH